MCEIVKYIKIKINSIGTLLAHWTVGKYGYSGQFPPIFSEAEEETIGASLSSLEHETGIFRALFYLIIMLREN